MKPEHWLTIPLRLRSLLRRAQTYQELDDELRGHLERKTAEYLAQGVTQEEAQRRTRLDLRGVAQTREERGDAGGVSWIEDLSHDLRYGLRMLRKSPGFTAIAVLTLALGIGANTAIFSLTDQILLRSLPLPNPDQLVVLRSPGRVNGHCWSDIDQCAQSFSYPIYKALRQQASAFSGLLAYRGIDVNVSGHGATERARGTLVSGNYFQTLEVTPALGRVFDSSDETAPGANTVAVLSYGYWTRQFGQDPSLLNKALVVNSVPLTVVGVARQGFDGVQLGETPDIFIPVTMKSQMMPTEGHPLEERGDFWLPVIGRLRSGISSARAQASLQPGYTSLLKEDASIRGGFSPDSLARYISKPLLLAGGSRGRLVLQQDAEEPLLILISMVGLVLLIACANLAGLLVARGEARRREIAVRLTLGARRSRVIRQLLTEAVVIGIAGGVAGIALASWCLNAAVGAIPPDRGMLGLARTLDFRVLSFAIALTFATAILFGLAPAIRATGADLQSMLKEQGSSVSEGRSNVTLRKLLIVAQVALTAVLLVVAGLFSHTLANLERANLGVGTSRLLQLSVSPDLNGETSAQSLQFADTARREIGALPGVRSVSISTIPIFANDDMGFNITPQSYAMRPGEDTNVLATYVGPSYFSTMGIPLMAGREFTDADGAKTPKLCIVNEKLAQRFFAGRSPIGLHIAQGAGNNVHPDIEIVGVVANSKWDGARSDILPFVYMPYAQDQHLGGLTFYVRTERDPAAMAATVRSAIQRLNPNLPVNNLRTLDEQVSASMFNDKLVAALSVSLGLLAALMATLGLYGVLAYMVARRTREIGIRMALGGQRGDILQLIAGQGARLTLMGGALGLVVALVATRWVASLLYGVTAHDPLTFLAVIVLLAFVTGVSSYVPVRRAMRVDLMVALRYE